MKKSVCFLLVTAMLLGCIFCLSSCSEDLYEVWRETGSGGETLVWYVNIDPFSLEPGDAVNCSLICYQDGNLDSIDSCWVISQWLSERFGENPSISEDREVLYIATLSSGSLKLSRRYNFEAKKWETNSK